MSGTPSGERPDSRTGRSASETGSTSGVLYLPRESDDDRSAPSALESEHGMAVTVVATRSAAVTALAEPSVDCVVVEGGTPASACRTVLEYVRDHRPDLPVIAYAGDEGDPQAWFRAGVDDYLSRVADTAERTLLAHRIERCVATRRAVEDRQRFETAVETVAHPILVADGSGRIEYVNRAFEALLDRDRHALLGRPLTVLQAATRDDAYRDCWKTVTGGEQWRGKLRVSGADGATRLHLTATPVRDDAGAIERIVVVGTDHDTHEPALEDARQKYRGLVDAAPDAILVADVDTGEIVEANEAAADLLDRPTSELVGMHQSELHPDEDRERYRRLFDYHRSAHGAIRHRFDDDPLYVETASGEHVPVEIGADVVELDDRTLLQGHFRDVSERRDRRRKLRSVLDAIPDIAIVYSESGRYEEVLSGREDLLVDSPAALEDADIHDALPAEQAERIHDAIRETVETGETRQLEYRLSLDDEVHHFEARIAPLGTEAYADECVAFLARDITARKRREQDLRSFREAVEHAGHVIMITETDGTIEYVNPAFENVTGYSKTAALGRTPSILGSGEHDDDCYRDLWETITDGEIWEGELVNQRADGERYHVEQTIAPITDENDTIERFVAVNTDITERKQYEAQLERERDRLEEFARTVAHDLRNPLSIALGHVDLARAAGGDDESPLDRALSALERMETMIDEVLTLSAQGKTVREPSPVRFERVVDVAWDHVTTDADAATLSTSYACAEWTVAADESRLRQLLENILGNAARHAGPAVTVRIGRLPDREGFFVEDDGPGIDPSERNRIFESGYTTAEGGTGFGLAIAKQIVEAHGWEITVTDGEDGGARFEVTTTTYRDQTAMDRNA